MKKAALFYSLLFAATFSSAQNIVSTYSGNGSTGFFNSTAAASTYNKPFGIAIDKFNNLYICDGGNNCIRKINTTTNTVTTYAGSGTAGFQDGAAATARFNSPADLCVDDSGYVYVSDFLNHRIRKISPTGTVSTIAGSGTAGYINATGTAARFNYPRGIVRDKAGNLYIGDSWNHRIRKITKTGVVTSYAGGGTAFGVGSTGSLVNANDTFARFYTPSGLGIDELGNIYVADAYNHRIRKISTTQAVTTFSGTGATGVGNGGFMNGSSSVAILNTPTEVYVDTVGKKMYIGDTFNNRVRKVDMGSGNVSTFAGSGGTGFTNAVDTLATFDYTRGIVLDTSGKKLYIVDYNNHAIRILTTNITGILEEKAFESLALYPNPSTGQFKMQNVNGKIGCFEVFDLLGKSLLKKEANADQTMVDLSGLEKGVYFVRIINGSGTITRKIILE